VEPLVPDCFDEVRDVILPLEILLPLAFTIALQGFEPVEGAPRRERIERCDVSVDWGELMSGKAEALHLYHFSELSWLRKGEELVDKFERSDASDND
jgi:hypothetical protein